MKKYQQLYVVIMFAALLAPNLATGETSEGTRAMFGMKFGYFGAGKLTIKEKGTTYDRDYDTRSDICGGVNLDYRIMPHFYLGGTADMARVYVNERNKEMMLVIGATLKSYFNVGPKELALSPGIGLGYGFLGEVLGVESSQYWILRMTMDFICPVGTRTAIINEIGLFWGVAGGDENYDVTGGPFLLFRSGFCFF